ncbi:hypothetical protein RYH73_06240 [Olivibacter sp. CPCC 100613]|uniref:hypothetical protein n=1 Tax=Olivibacter sp. CPCC 100613 TaxID=3079931 RepID=UPI002FF8C363
MKMKFFALIFMMGVYMASYAQNTFPTTGNVGIGTSSPTNRLDIRGTITMDNGTNASIFTGIGTTELNRYLILLNSAGLSSASGLKAGGILVADTYAYANPGKNDLVVKGRVGIGVQQPDLPLMVFNDYGTGNSGYLAKFGAKRNWTINDWEGIQLGFSHIHSIYEGNSLWGLRLSTGSSTDVAGKEAIRISGSGNVGIGTTNPQAKLAVNGNILAKEIKVKTDISVPDYVFESDYNLQPLTEIEDFVKEHKHLPEVPSAKTIGEEGLDLAQMNLLLLKKVEELTLHQIELLKELKQLKSELNNHINENHTK